MKRILWIVAGVVLVVVLAGAALIGSAFLGRQSITDGFESNGVRIVKDGFVSVGVVPTGAGKVVLIDAGNDASAAAILADLSRHQLGADAVTAIFLTHGHPDHTTGVRAFSGARVLSLDREVGLVEGREGAHGPLTRLMPVSPTGIKVSDPLMDGQTVTVGDVAVRAFAVPGHTAGSAAYLVNGVLFMGDAADASSSGNVTAAPWVFSDSQAEDRESLIDLERRLEDEKADVKVIAFAHSGVKTDGLASLAAFAQR